MQITLILWNIRSAHNVGSILRSAECFGVRTVWCIGITPYPLITNDPRLPHISRQAHAKIAKTALGAESLLDIQHADSVERLMLDFRTAGIRTFALEQTQDSIPLHDSSQRIADRHIALVLGNEPLGIAPDVLAACDGAIEIVQYGSKESLNVSVAAGIALYALTCA